jgi:hypothetical protein
MLKRLKTSLPLIAIAGVSAMSLGMVAALVDGVNQANLTESVLDSSEQSGTTGFKQAF